MAPILLSLATFFSTSFGGLFAVKHKNRLHLVMGFTAGVLIGVVSFDIFPEIIDLIKNNNFVLSALALTGHSFMDGVGIGLGFQVSPAVGLIVAIAVIAHDFTDGMNTVILMLTNRNTEKKAKTFLFFDALAPVAGVISTLFFHLPESFLILYLGFFAGFLLYIGASDILPEAHRNQSSWKIIGLTITGTVFIFIVTRFA